MLSRPPGWLGNRLSSLLVCMSLLLAMLVVYTPVGQASSLILPATPTAEALATSTLMPSEMTATATSTTSPAPTPSPTSTLTPTATATLSPSATPLPSPTSTPQATATLAPEPASEVVVVFDNPWCQAGCLTLQGWDELVANEQLLAVLAMIYHYHPAMRELLQRALEKEVTIAFGELPMNTTGQYTSGFDRIEIATLLIDEPLSITAETLSHEITHAARIDGPHASPESCVEEEVIAFSNGADTWELMRLGIEQSPYRAWLDQLVEMKAEGRLQAYLQDYVRSSATYQQQCFGVSATVL